MPKNIRGLFPKEGSKSLRYSKHSVIRAKDKNVELPDTVNLSNFSLIELEVCSGIFNKAVIRSNTPDVNGNCIVLVVMKTEYKAVWFVKTTWYNDLSDNHATLCLDGYERKV
jgi:hypothetical protein